MNSKSLPRSDSADLEKQQSLSPNQLTLLRQTRFAPFFWTQFCGAANDNLFKYGLTLLLTYQVVLTWITPVQAGLLIAALFITPFLFFSAISGQLADHYDKVRLMVWIKNLEILIMILATIGFIWLNTPLLLICIFLLGLHSTFFGPLKYAYLPEVLHPHELTGGNGMVEMGTFAAIWLGSLLGGLLISNPKWGVYLLSIACLAIALLGRWQVGRIPKRVAQTSVLPVEVEWNPLIETWRNLKAVSQTIFVFRSLLGISWMWFYGAVFLTLFPAFTKDVLRGSENVASLMLVIFTICIGFGALMCEVIEKCRRFIPLVPLGLLGMSLFSFDLYWATETIAPKGLNLGVFDFLSHSEHWRILLDLGLISLSIGLFSVPLYTKIQLLSSSQSCARVIAANNVLNAIFMIVSALGLSILLANDFSIPEVFLLVSALNVGVLVYVWFAMPEYRRREAENVTRA